MKIKTLFFLLGVIIIVASCNKVEFPNKPTTALIDVSDTIFPDTNTNNERHVLVEEFTGQTCAPCPGGAKALRDLHTLYDGLGKELILVAIHEGSQSAPHTAPDTSFLTEWRVASGGYFANTLFSPGNLPGTPSALINRVPYDLANPPWIYKSDWQSSADAEFAKPNIINLDMVATFDTLINSGTIAVRTWFLTNLTSEYYLVVYLTQDSIVNWQKNGPSGIGDDAYPLNQDVSNYVHRHVFRGCLSNDPGGSGILISSGSVSSGTKIIKAFNFNLASLAANEELLPGPRNAFDPKHFIFIAYVYDLATNEVLQVIEQHLY